jgi:hypothetical protein
MDLVIEIDEERLDAGQIVRDVTEERGYVPVWDGKEITGRRVFHNHYFQLIHQDDSDGTDSNYVYYRGDFVYRDRRTDDRPPVVDIYRTGIWERHIRSEFHLAQQTELEF